VVLLPVAVRPQLLPLLQVLLLARQRVMARRVELLLLQCSGPGSSGHPWNPCQPWRNPRRHPSL
jgi:hypothetical protein